MTLESLYDQLTPIIQRFYDEQGESCSIHAASSILCFIMRALQQAVDNEENEPLLSLSLVVGKHMMQEEMKRMIH